MNSSATDYGGGLSDDLLRIYFDSDRGTTTDIYFAKRARATDAFDAPVVIAELVSPSFDGNSTLTGDELDMLFSSQRAGDCIYETTRASLADTWGPVQKIDALCPGIQTTGPSVSSDGLRLYFNAIGMGTGVEGQVLYSERATRTSAWSAPVTVAGLDPDPKGFVTVTEDELTLWYEQQVGQKIHVFEATRTSKTDPFGPASRTMWMGPDSETDPAVSHDGKTMLFMSDRTGAGDMYTMTRACQ